MQTHHAAGMIDFCNFSAKPAIYQNILQIV